jgi:hypothetical protein
MGANAMTERDVARIERALDVKLPVHYVRFLIDHGAAVAKAKRAGGFVPYFTTAKEIIDANQELRANPSLRVTNQDTVPWPLKYLIVGTDGGGNDWCVDLKSKREVIWFFDHESYGTFRHADIATWSDILEELQSPKPVVREILRSYVCKQGKPAADTAGDGSFCVKDAKRRDWLCFERREMTEEEKMAEIMARVRGEAGIPMPAWIGEKGLRDICATSVEELSELLSKQR